MIIDELKEIQEKLKDNKISLENINLIGFDKDQMDEIRYGLQKGLSIEQVSIYAKLEFDWKQMAEIRLGLQKGLSIEQVLTYAKSEFTSSQMFELRTDLERGMSIEQISIFAKPEFNNVQMAEIRLGLENGLSIEQVKTYANPDLSSSQMACELEKLLIKNINKEAYEILYNSKFNDSQLNQIRIGLQNGLSIEQISIYAKPEFNIAQIIEIRKGFKNGLSIEQASAYAKPEIDASKMHQFREMLEHKMPIEDVIKYTKFNDLQINQIEYGLADGLSPQQISIYAKPEIDWKTMQDMRFKIGDLVSNIDNEEKLNKKLDKISNAANKIAEKERKKENINTNDNNYLKYTEKINKVQKEIDELKKYANNLHEEIMDNQDDYLNGDTDSLKQNEQLGKEERNCYKKISRLEEKKWKLGDKINNCNIQQEILETEINKALNSKDVIEKDVKSINKDSIDREER